MQKLTATVHGTLGTNWEGRALGSGFWAATPHVFRGLQRKKKEPSSSPREPERTDSCGGAQVTIDAWTGRSRDEAARLELQAEEVTWGPPERQGPGSQALGDGWRRGREASAGLTRCRATLEVRVQSGS